MTTFDIPNDLFFDEVRHQLAEGRTVTIRVRGWSMRPFLEHDRDRVVLSAVPASGAAVYDVALAQDAAGRYLLHRVVERHADGSLTLRGDGNVRGTEHIPPGHVIAVVRGFYRPQGLRGQECYFSAQGEAWRKYSAWWMARSSRQRRYWLLAYRILKKLRIIL